MLLRPTIAVLLLFNATADAAVLCAKRRSDGTFHSTVRVRETCRQGETVLTPEAVGFCCEHSTTTTSTSTSVTSTPPCPTVTTLGVPDCGGISGPPSCLGNCTGGRTCADDGNGHCLCTGTGHCGVQNFCGGDCPSGLGCQPLPVPEGCPSIGCGCQ